MHFSEYVSQLPDFVTQSIRLLSFCGTTCSSVETGKSVQHEKAPLAKIHNPSFSQSFGDGRTTPAMQSTLIGPFHQVLIFARALLNTVSRVA